MNEAIDINKGTAATFMQHQGDMPGCRFRTRKYALPSLLVNAPQLIDASRSLLNTRVVFRHPSGWLEFWAHFHPWQVHRLPIL